MFTHTPVTAVQARGLLNPLIVEIAGGRLIERSLAQESICTHCQFSRTTFGLVAARSGCCLSSSSSFSCCVGDARRKGELFSRPSLFLPMPPRRGVGCRKAAPHAVRVRDVLPAGASARVFTELGIFCPSAPVAGKHASHAMWLREQRKRLRRKVGNTKGVTIDQWSR